jgi:hypothetical protein
MITAIIKKTGYQIHSKSWLYLLKEQVLIHFGSWITSIRSGRRHRRKKTLKIVAKHADACNLFGSPDTITRKLEVLLDHCKKIGRNYDTILKTKLSHVIIAKDREEAERRVNERFGEMDKESRREFVIYGTPLKYMSKF